MASNRGIKKTKVMAIVHGKSEFCICSNIKSNLKIKHEIIGRDRGKSSIQISSIIDFLLSDKRFINMKNFLKAFDDIEHTKKELINFKLFIIMDVDDCTELQKQQFINKELFKKHWLYEYIVPIYNELNLEDVMKKCSIEVQKKSQYILIFPTNHGDLDLTKAESFSQKLSKCKNTNLENYVNYCIGIAKENLLPC